MILVRLVVLLVVWSAISVPSVVNACADIVPFKVEYIRKADSVFTGKIVRYDQIKRSAVLTVRVNNVIKGSVPKEVELYWASSTNSQANERGVQTPLLFAAVSVKTLEGGDGKVISTARPDLPHLLQEPCSLPFLLDDTAQNIRKIRMILEGREVPPHDYSARRHQAMIAEGNAELARQELIKRLIAAFGIGIIAIVLVVTVWRRAHAF